MISCSEVRAVPRIHRTDQCPSMRTLAVKQIVASPKISIEDQIFAQQTYRLGGLVVEFLYGRHRMPIGAQQGAHARARADFRQKLVGFLSDQCSVPRLSGF